MNINIKTQIKWVTYSLFALIFSASLAIAATPQETSVIPAYKIGPGDVLNISVWKEEGLQQEVLIRPDGGMSFPLAGDIQAGGKSVSELSDMLVEKIKKYIPDPVITVAVRKIENNKIYKPYLSF